MEIVTIAGDEEGDPTISHIRSYQAIKLCCRFVNSVVRVFEKGYPTAESLTNREMDVDRKSIDEVVEEHRAPHGRRRPQKISLEQIKGGSSTRPEPPSVSEEDAKVGD